MSEESRGEKKTIKSFMDLEVWQKAHLLVIEIYKHTKDYPAEEKYTLVSQMRRAAISVPGNITEGFRKLSNKDKINYYNIAQGSLDELYYYIILSKELGYIKEYQGLQKHIDETARMLNGLIKSIRERQ